MPHFADPTSAIGGSLWLSAPGVIPWEGNQWPNLANLRKQRPDPSGVREPPRLPPNGAPLPRRARCVCLRRVDFLQRVAQPRMLLSQSRQRLPQVPW